MKIVHTESSCGWGGQELRVLEEAQGMTMRGHEVLLVSADQARITSEAIRRKLPVKVLPVSRKSVQGIVALRALIHAVQPQVVNTHSSTDSWLTAIACIGLPHRPFIVRTRHISAPIPDNLVTRWLYKRATSRIVTTGESLRVQVIAQTGVDKGRVISVPTGIDIDCFSPGDALQARAELGLNQHAFIVGIVATLRSWKGHRYLLDAIASIGDSSVKLVIVGGGPGEANLRNQAKDLGIEERVLFAGHQDNVVPWLRALDIFALPSYANEGVPQAIMQAMACGIPVITTAVGAIGEIALQGKTALVVAPKDVGALAAAIIQLRASPALAASLSGAALEQARGRFTRDAMLDAMHRVFADLVGGRQ